MIKAVFFDLDGTLFDRDATIAAIVAWQVRAFSSVIPSARTAEFCSKVATLDNHGQRDKRDVFATIGAELGLAPSVVEQLIATFSAEYPRHCRADDDVIDTLAALRDRGTPLGIVTNGASAVQDAAIDAIGVRSFMDVILVSEAEGIRKPHAEIFHRAAARIGVRPGECCFVGDNPAVDVAGAQAAGFFGVWKRTPYWSPDGHVPTIDRVSEILSLVS
jgi:putative hydrolase of the HAD superfamily